MFFLAGSFAVHAQDTGWITGSVTDQTGAAVPKATVNLMLHGGAKPVATTVTTPQGLFRLETLRPVYYDLTIDAPGFQQYKLDNLKVDASRPTDLPKITLAVATVASSVSVTAGLETVQTTSPELSTTVTAEQIERLPVGDRNPLAFISTQAGVSPGNANGYETDINGQRSSFSNVTLDGINIQDNFIRTGDLDYTPNEPLLSQIQDFTVITSNQGAASAGGASQVNFTTPSGTNQYPRRGVLAESQQRFRGQRLFRQSGRQSPAPPKPESGWRQYRRPDPARQVILLRDVRSVPPQKPRGGGSANSHLQRPAGHLQVRQQPTARFSRATF